MVNTTVRRFALVVSALIVWSNPADAQILPQYEQPFWVAPLSGVSGSSIQGTCVAFLPPTPSRLHIRCVNIQGGRTPTSAQLVSLDHIFGERALVNAPFAGGSTFTLDINNVEARTVNDLINRMLSVQINSSAGPEGLGRFAPADETRTLFPMTPVQGGQDRLGMCETSTIPSPPMLSFFCEHNISGPANFIFHEGTVANRGPELFRVNFSGNAGNDIISGIVDANNALINAVNTQSTNANILNSSNWIGGNNMACHPGPATLCLNLNRFRIQIDWRNSQGQTGVGKPAASGDDTGLFYFLDPSNVEVMVKVLDSCNVNSRYWVFAGGMTNVEYRMEVTDTRSGQTKTYINPLGTPAPAITDTNAFATCP